MSIERDVETPGGTKFKYTPGMTKDDIKKGLHIEVLDRGRQAQRLDMSHILPSDVHGEWIHKDDIDEMKDYGFEVDAIYGKAKKLHDDGTGRTQVGDAVLMTCPMIVKEAIDEARQEAYIRRHGKPGRNTTAIAEEREFINQARKVGDEAHMDFFGQSVTSQIGGAELMSTITKKQE